MTIELRPSSHGLAFICNVGVEGIIIWGRLASMVAADLFGTAAVNRIRTSRLANLSGNWVRILALICVFAPFGVVDCRGGVGKKIHVSIKKGI